MSGWCERCGFDYRPVLGLPHDWCWDGVADSAAVRSWVEAASEPHELRFVAGYYIGRLRTAAAQDALEELVDHRAAPMRAAALQSLARVAPGDSIEALARALADPDADVRRAARMGLGEVGGQAAIEALRADSGTAAGDEWMETTSARAVAGDREALEDVRALVGERLGEFTTTPFRTFAWMLVRLGDATDRSWLHERVVELESSAHADPDPVLRMRADHAQRETYDALRDEYPDEFETLADAIAAARGMPRIKPSDRVPLEPLEPRTVAKHILVPCDPPSRGDSALVGKFGGQPDWVGEPTWPLGAEGRPMIFYGQLRLPGDTDRMAYIFLSGDSQAHTFTPLGDGNALVLQPGAPCHCRTAPRAEGPQRLNGVAPASGVQYVRFEPGADPQRWTWPEPPLGTYRDSLHGDWNKIGGTPLFLQGEEYPPGDGWRFAFQFTGGWAGWDPGDGAELYGFVTEQGAGALLWQCH